MRAVTTKTAFTEEEWARVVRAPLVAGMAMSLADPGGPIEATKESVASLKSATNPPSREQLLAEVALEVQSMAQARRNPLGGFKLTKDRPPREQLLEELEGAYRTVAAKGTSEELRGVRPVVGGSGAGGSGRREGGGIHGHRRSTRERGRTNNAGAAFAPWSPATTRRTTILGASRR